MDGSVGDAGGAGVDGGTGGTGGAGVDAGADATPSSDTGGAADTAPPAPPVIAPYVGGDIGTTGGSFAGNTAANDTQALTITATGTGIGGTADSFHFTRVAARGDAQVLGIIRSHTMAGANTMSGVMFRESLDPDAAMVFVGPTGDGMSGRVVIRRQKGAAAVVAPMDAMMAPAPSLKTAQWLRLQRLGNNVLIYVGSRQGVSDPNAQPIGTIPLTLANPGQDAYYGIAATAGVAGMSTTVDVQGFQVDNLGADPATASLRQYDMGTLGGVALHNKAMNTLSVTGWGQDWGTVAGTYREFATIVGRPGAGDLSAQVRIDSLDNTSPNARAGLLYRAEVRATSNGDITTFNFSRSAGGVSLSLTPGAGLVLAGRLSGYQETKWDTIASAPAVKAPVWVRLDKVQIAIPNDPLGGTQTAIAAYYSTPGPNGKPTDWTQIGTGLALAALPGATSVPTIGLHVTSANPTALATAVFNDLTWAAPSPVTLPAPDAGAPADAAGSVDAGAPADASAGN
jgi:hypothetical protein